jgi:hypothetical protein
MAAACAAVACALALLGLAVQQWVASKRYPDELPPGAKLDASLRVVMWPGKREIACPAASQRVATVLILGQSNAGNHAQSASESSPDDSVLNWFEGKCYVASSPLLGATGQRQQPWTPMARLMLKPGRLERVVLAPIAVAGSPIARWAKLGELHPVLLRDAARLQAQLGVTAVLWIQGEADFARSTGADAYASMLRDVVATIRQAGIEAPIYVYTATWCIDTARWTQDNALARAQRAVALPGTRPGVDLDALLVPQDRFDGCHLSESGVRKVARASSVLLEAATR